MKNKKELKKKKDKRALARKLEHLIRPPRLEGKVKNAKMNLIRKKKKKIL
jgi:hypothetical protein